MHRSGLVSDLFHLILDPTRDYHEVIDELKNIERCAVLFSIDGIGGHWVGVEFGKVAFNPKLHSDNLANGKPISARILKVA